VEENSPLPLASKNSMNPKDSRTSLIVAPTAGKLAKHRAVPVAAVVEIVKAAVAEDARVNSSLRPAANAAA
jgi:hypothetical protein